MPIALGGISFIQEGTRGAGSLPAFDGEANFIRGAQNGDVRAFNDLARAYQTRAYRLAYRILGDEQMAGDAVQEAFLSAFRHIRKLRNDSFGAWLMRIVTNACYDQLRTKQKQRSTSLETLAGGVDKTDPWFDRMTAPESPHDFVERRELNDFIQHGLETLPFDQRVAVILADAENHSYEQISEITGANVGTVKSRLARGRRSLRDFLLAEQDLLPSKYRHHEARLSESEI